MSGARSGPPRDRTPVDWSREPHEFRRVGDDGYVLSMPTLGISFDIDRVRRERQFLVGELTVRCALAGAQTYDGILLTGSVTLSWLDARSKLANRLAALSNADDVPWHQLVEELATRVRAHERNGDAAVLLREVPRPAPEDVIDIDGLRLIDRHPIVLFGDGGTAKSYLALYVAGRLAERGVRVGIFDWELASEDHRDRLERLFGPEMPDVRYVRCARPLVDEADRLRRIVAEHEIGYAIFDSVAFACAGDGPPEAAEVAGRYFQAVRRIGLGSLHIAHVSKSDGADLKPFGSAFWANGARATWFCKLAEALPGGQEITIGLYNRKSNLGGIRPAVGFTITFDEERTTFRRVNVADVADLAARLPLSQRIVSLLRRGPMTIATIAETLEEKPDSVTKAVKRGEGKAFVRRVGKDGVFEVGLLDRRAGP